MEIYSHLVYISNTPPGFLEEEPSYSRTSLIESWALESSVTRASGDNVLIMSDNQTYTS